MASFDTTLSAGQYLFNDSPSVSNSYHEYQVMTFYNGDTKYEYMSIDVDTNVPGTPEISISFYPKAGSTVGGVTAYQIMSDGTGGWVNDNYRYIELAADQTVSTGFMEVFDAVSTNATAFLYGSYRGVDDPEFYRTGAFYNFNFVSAGTAYTRITVGTSVTRLIQYSAAATSYITAYSSSSWNDEYRVVNVDIPTINTAIVNDWSAWYTRVYDPVAPTYQFKRLYDGATIGTGSYVFKKLQDTIPVYTVTVNATGEHFTVSYDLDAGQTREGNVITGAAGTTVSVHFVADDGYTLGEISHTTTSGTVTDISTNSSGDYNIEFADSDAVITFTVTTQSTTVYTLSGAWVWNDHPNLIEGAGVDIPYSTDVSFASNGNSYSKIVIVSTYTGSSEEMSISYVTSANVSTTVLDGVEGTTAVWSNAAYKTIDFGATPQQVPEAFYNYFTENAEQVYQVSGVYVWKDTVSAASSQFMQNVSFTDTAGTAWKVIIVGTDNIMYGDEPLTRATYTTVYQEGSGWDLAAYKTIDFGETPQTVSKEFYDYFKENANIQDTGGAI